MDIIDIEKLKVLEGESVNDGLPKTMDLIVELTRLVIYRQTGDDTVSLANDTLKHYGFILETEESKPKVSPHNFGGHGT